MCTFWIREVKDWLRLILYGYQDASCPEFGIDIDCIATIIGVIGGTYVRGHCFVALFSIAPIIFIFKYINPVKSHFATVTKLCLHNKDPILNLMSDNFWVVLIRSVIRNPLWVFSMLYVNYFCEKDISFNSLFIFNLLYRSCYNDEWYWQANLVLSRLTLPIPERVLHSIALHYTQTIPKVTTY